MKQILIKIPIIFLSLLLLSLSILNSCKKTDKHTELENNAAIQEAKVLETVRAQYGSITAPVIFQPHKKATSIYYLDDKGVKHPIDKIGSGPSTDAVYGTGVCATNSTAPLNISATLEYVRWYYTCAAGGSPTTTGHSLNAVWKISVPFGISTNSSILGICCFYSSGSFNIKNTSGTVLASGGSNASPIGGPTGGPGNMTLTNDGADPVVAGNTLYTVSYTWENISDAYFPGNEVECAFGVYADCPRIGNGLYFGYTQGIPYTGTTTLFSDPCDRTDQVFIVPPSSSMPASVASAYTSCLPPFGFTGTSHQQVEYREVTHPTSLLWDDQFGSAIHGGVYSGTTTEVSQMSAYGDVLFLPGVNTGSGTWLIRYRNRHSTGCNNVADSWNGNYITEIRTY